MVRTILLDMDEVLADFVGSALKVHGWTKPQLYGQLVPGTWKFANVMGLEENQFWKPITKAGVDFWANLQPLPWLRDLITLVEKRVGENWYVVSTPSRCPSSYAGKARWVRQHLGDKFNRLVLTGHKHLLANPDTMLIDDREETIERFVQHGGRARIFPSMHNCLYEHAANPLAHLEKML